MLNIPEEVKELFRDGQSHRYNMRLEFGNSRYFTEPTYTIENSNIEAESAKLTETLCSGSRLTFGDINPSVFNVNVITDYNIVNMYMKVTLIYDDYEIPYGRYIVVSASTESGSMYKKVKAYDYLFLLKKSPPKNWWTYSKGYLKQAEANAKYVITVNGLEYEDFTLTNDFRLNGTLDHKSLSWSDILKYAAEINGGWFRADRYGKIVFHTLPEIGQGTIENIGTTVNESMKDYGYTSKVYDGISVNFTDGERDVYEYIPEGSAGENLYEIDGQNDYMAYLTESDLNSRCEAIYNLISGKTYAAYELECDGRPYVEPGDMISVNFTYESAPVIDENGNESQASSAVRKIYYVMSQKISGIGGLMHHFSASAENEKYDSNYDAFKKYAAKLSTL